MAIAIVGRGRPSFLRYAARPAVAALRPWGTCGTRFLALPSHTVLTMPALSPTMTQGNIAAWLKKEGDSIRAGDTIAQVETDKATVDFEVLDDGIVAKLLVAEGASDLTVGTPVAVLVDDAANVAAFKDFKADAAPSSAPPAPPAAAAPTPPPAAPPQQAHAPPPPPPAAAPAPRAPTATGGSPASPLARRLAAEKGLNIASITGSGPNGRVIAADVEAASATQPTVAADAAKKAAPAGPTFAPGAVYEDVPHNNIRKVIAKRLTESKQAVPHYYLSMECSLDELIRLRSTINEAVTDKAHKVSVNDFIVKASARALTDVPQANAAWFDDFVRTYKHADICVAVSTDKGLITPIITAADRKGLAQISAEAKELAARARANKLKPEEFQGGTFTVSNLGMFGIKHFTAIINPPQAAILAVGGAEKRVISDGKGGFKEGSFMVVTLSSDHRVIDGAVGAQWLSAFKKYIENPVLMLI